MEDAIGAEVKEACGGQMETWVAEVLAANTD
jgi:hypothetical protein